jgi:hypothetical protein
VNQLTVATAGFAPVQVVLPRKGIAVVQTPPFQPIVIQTPGTTEFYPAEPYSLTLIYKLR